MTRFDTTVLTVLAVLLAACAWFAPVTASAKTKDAVAPVAPSEVKEKLKSATIDGFVGGTVTCSKWSVVVPPGAFRGTATITITESGVGEKTVDLAITPESMNHFLVPVKLQYKKTDGSENIATQSIYWWNPETLAWEPAPNQTGDVVNGTLTSGLLHFSTYRVLGGRAGW